MASAAEQLNEIYKGNLDTVRQFAALFLDTAENLLKLQLQAAREMLVKDRGPFGALWLSGSLSKAATAWPEFYQDNAQKGLDMARNYMEGVAKAQSEFARLIQDQAAVANKSFVESMQGLGSAAKPAGPVEHKPRRVA